MNKKTLFMRVLMASKIMCSMAVLFPKIKLYPKSNLHTLPDVQVWVDWQFKIPENKEYRQVFSNIKSDRCLGLRTIVPDFQYKWTQYDSIN